MGQGQRESGSGCQAGEEAQEAIKRGWTGGHHRRHQGPMGQIQKRGGHTGGPQKDRSPDQSEGQGQAGRDCPGQVGRGQSRREEQLVGPLSPPALADEVFH
jgi:hypothetical protein